MGYSPNIQNVKTALGDSIDVFIQDQTTPSVNLYLYLPTANPNLTSDASINDIVLNIDDNTGIADGDAITIYEGVNFFQSIVKSTTAPPGATLTMRSKLDRNFTTAADIETGTCNANKNGSVVPVEFEIKPPLGVTFDVYTINLAMTDADAMDSAKFGGISALTDGIVIKHENGTHNNIALIYNNIGFSHQGFDTIYDDKAPAGVYGVRHRLNLKITNGIAVRLEGSMTDKLKFVIRDDLTELITLLITIQGHVVSP